MAVENFPLISFYLLFIFIFPQYLKWQALLEEYIIAEDHTQFFAICEISESILNLN